MSLSRRLPVAALLAALAALASLLVAAPAQAATTIGAWTAAGPGTVTTGGTADSPAISYDYDLGQAGGVPTQTWTFSHAAAAADGSVDLDYDYQGLHAWFAVTVFLRAFVIHDGTTTQSLVAAGPASCCTTPSGGFHYTGTAHFDLKAGDTYGFELGGGNGDYNSFVNGTLTLSPPTPASPYTVDATSLENTTWATAKELHPSPTDGDVGVLAQPGETRWYKFAVVPDSTVQLDLDQLPADYDLTLFGDIGKAFNDQVSGTHDLTKLSAEFAGDAFAPSVFSPSVFSPSVFSPSVFSPSVFSPSVFSPSVFSPSVFSPSVFSPSVFSPSVFSPSVFSPSVFSPSVFSPSVFSQAWSSAQTRSLIAVSAHDGLAPESIKANTWNNTGYFYVRVAARNGVTAGPSATYHLTVAETDGSCAAPLDPHSGDATLHGAPGPETVVITDSSRIDTAAGGLGTALVHFGGQPDVAVVDVAGSPKVAALNAQADGDPGCTYAKNLVAQAIRDIVNSYRGPDLKYVVIAGDDDVVPFFRYPDTAGLGPESGYVPPLADGSAGQASLRTNTLLSQDAYGAATDVLVKGVSLPVPDLAVGRLVETPAEIAGTIERYLGGSTQIDPTSSLTTGYDFLADAAGAVHRQFADGIGGSDTANDTLIQPNGDAPADSWTAADLKTKLFGAKHDVTFLAGHFSANSALAADFSTSVLTTDLAQAVHDQPGLFRDTLVMSAGCHSGYNLEDADGIGGLTLGLDWVQALSQAGASVVAGTGYQYGDTDFLEYSERLYLDFAKQLRTGTGVVPIGAALARAKQQYLADTPQVTGIHEKAVLEATLYGLPMLGMNMPGSRLDPPTSSSAVTPTAVSSDPGQTLGLQVADHDFSTTTTPASKDRVGADGATLDPAYSWLSGDDGVVTNPAQPALPLQKEDVSVPGEVLRGVGFRSGDYTDNSGVVPLTGAPATELNGVHSTFSSPAFFPQQPWSVNYFGALADGSGGQTTLMLTPAQYRSDDTGTGTDVERAFKDLGLRLFYSDNTATYGDNTPALASPPTISGVSSSVDGGVVTVSAHVTGDPAAGIQQAWLTYTEGPDTNGVGHWRSVDLAQDPTDSTLWTATFTPSDPAKVRFLLQAANGVGLVVMDNNLGAFYTPGVPVGTVVSGDAVATQLALDAPGSGVHGDTVDVSATLSGADGGPLAGKPVTLSLGTSSATVTTGDDGTAHASLPLVDRAGDYPVSATFGGDATAAPALASQAFTITKRPTSLAVAAGDVLAGGVPHLVATLTSDGTPVRNQPVAIVVTGADGHVVTSSVHTTRLDGTMAFDPAGLAVGGYHVTAYFGQASVDVGSSAVDLTDPDLAGSTDTTSFDVVQATTVTRVDCPGSMLVDGSEACTIRVSNDPAYAGPPAPTPSGQVAVSDEAAAVAPATCDLGSDGTCTVTLTPATTLTDTVSASYGGDTTHVGSSGSADVVVGYGFDGMLKPLNDPASGSTTMSVVKGGSTVPLKFRLTDAAGNLIPDDVAAAIANDGRATYSLVFGSSDTEPVNEDLDTATPTPGTAFRYDASAHQFVLNLGTKGMSQGTWTLKVKVRALDGTVVDRHVVEFGIR